MPYRRIDVSILKNKEIDKIDFRDFEAVDYARARARARLMRNMGHIGPYRFRDRYGGQLR